MPHPFEALQLNKGNLQRLLTSLTTGIVTTVSGGTTGLTPSSPTGGAVVLAGTLNVANGGTGVTTKTGTGSVVLNTSATLVTPVIGVATGTSLAVTGDLTSASGTAITSGGSLTGFKFFNTTAGNFGVFGGTGSPTIVANRGSLYLDSSARAPFYNTDGSTGWRQLTPTSELVIRTQAFTVSGTYTPHGNMVYCQIECWGGGGGGGGIANTAATIQGSAAGGGAGSYSRKISSRAAIIPNQTVTIGAAGTGGSAGANAGNAGGDTSVGTLCIGKAGQGGPASDGAATRVAGGAGGVAGTGDLTATGQAGGGTFLNTNIINTAIGGGSSTIGGGGITAATTTPTTGAAATGKASGGGGGNTFSATGAAAGGDGTAGYVFITEWCSA